MMSSMDAEAEMEGLFGADVSQQEEGATQSLSQEGEKTCLSQTCNL